MSKAMIMTVGGSDEPIVQSIKSYNPDFIYFICSGGSNRAASSPTVDGEGNVCCRKEEIKCKCGEIIRKGEYYPNIIKQSGYKGKYEKVEISDPDNFEEVYTETSNTIKKAKQKNYEIIADFTGGTKTMSSVLAMLSALDFEIKLSLTIGQRKDLIRTSSASVPVTLDVDLPRIEHVLHTVDILISSYLYYPAALILDELLRKGLKQELTDKIRHKLNMCKVFSYWDSFQYAKAFEILQSYANEYKREFDNLLKILEKSKRTSYERVWDLISNAERQAFNGYYDNAIARLYRALELFAQIRLKTQHQIDTSTLEKSIDKLKNKEKWEKKKNEKGEIKIGLKDAYEVLLELDDPVGKVYQPQKEKFIDNIKLRNESPLAHGDRALSEKEWAEFSGFFHDFVEMCCKSINLTREEIKLPTEIKL